MIQLRLLRRYPKLTFFLCAFLLVFGSRLVLIGRYGSDLPYQDEWGKEGDFVLAPLREGNPVWLPGALLPHNEHRIYFTLALDVSLTLIAGQWDKRLECVASALLAAAIAASLALFAWQNLSGRWRAVATGVVLALAALPFAWENVLWAFQSQFYFLIGFSLLGMDGLLRRTFSPRWWIGLLAMLCALVTMGSGFLCAVAVLPLLARDFWRDRDWKIGLSFFAATACFCVGWWIRFEPPWHAVLRSSNWADFVRYAAHCLAWPAPGQPIMALLFYSPLLILAVHWFGGGARAQHPENTAQPVKLILAAGIWALLQIAAVSYARGGDHGLPANRYGDVFAIGVIANAFALGFIAPALRRWRHGWVTLAAVWLIALLIAAAPVLTAAYRSDLPQHRRQFRAFEATIRAYLANGDAAALRSRPIPFPDYDWFLRLLNRPSLRAFLPPSVSPSGGGSLLPARALVNFGWFLIVGSFVGLILAAAKTKRAPP